MVLPLKRLGSALRHFDHLAWVRKGSYWPPVAAVEAAAQCVQGEQAPSLFDVQRRPRSSRFPCMMPWNQYVQSQVLSLCVEIEIVRDRSLPFGN
eukprot:2052098-Pleurochrysis_carterae.AAC.1